MPENLFAVFRFQLDLLIPEQPFKKRKRCTGFICIDKINMIDLFCHILTYQFIDPVKTKNKPNKCKASNQSIKKKTEILPGKKRCIRCRTTGGTYYRRRGSGCRNNSQRLCK